MITQTIPYRDDEGRRNGAWRIKNSAGLLKRHGISDGTAKFFRFEVHSGDDNDNWIDEIIVEARTKSEAFDRLPTLDRHNAENMDRSELERRYGYDVDGDSDSLLESWYDYPEIDETDAEDEDDYNENYGRMIHQDWYLQGTYQTDKEAEADRSRYHGNSGILYLED